jgi:hypothetical protein
MKRMNKFFTLVFAALAFTAFTACSDDKSGPDGDNIAPEGEAWTTLRISSTSDNLGRAITNPMPGDTYPSTSPEETEAQEVLAIFFNGYDATSVVTDVKKITLNASNISDAFLVSDKSKSILVVVNPPSNFPNFTKGQSFSEVNAALAVHVDIYTDNKFMMTNAKGGLEPSLADGSPATGLPLFENKADAEQAGNAMKINVDRVVAKVRVFVSYNSTEAFQVRDANWVVNLTNLWYYPVSERVKTFLDTPTTLDEYRLGTYRIDPNFDHTNIPYPSQDFDDQYKYYTQDDVDNNSIVWITPCDALDPNNGGKPQYCAENTQRKEDNTYAYTTQVLLKAVYLPKYKTFDGQITDVQEGNNDWMDINGGFYTYTVMLGWIEDELTKKYQDQNPAGYVTNVTTAFNKYLKYLQNKGVANVQEVVIPDAAGVRTVADIVQDFVDQKAGVVAHGADMDDNEIVKYYDAGISYYPIAIKHDNDNNNSNNEFGEFGVVRNSMYDIKVNSFNNPGYPIIPKPDPGKKDEFEHWLAIEIGVNPWTWYTQEVDL